MDFAPNTLWHIPIRPLELIWTMIVKGSEANLWCSVALVTISCGVLNQPYELWLSEVLNYYDIVIGSERAIGVY